MPPWWNLDLRLAAHPARGVSLFAGAENLPQADKVAIYLDVYRYALIVPLISVTGVCLALALRRRQGARG